MPATVDCATEYVVLCGAEHERIGYASKTEIHHDQTPLHLAFSCYLFDEDNRFLVSWRATTKPTWPGVRTNSCCGHPGPGEPVKDAVARRLSDELGMVVDRIDLILPSFRYEATMDNGMRENELCPVYRATVTTAGATMNPDPTEVDKTMWMPWQEFVAEALADPDSVSPWSAIQVKQLNRLGSDPWQWPAGDSTQLPAVARETLPTSE